MLSLLLLSFLPLCLGFENGMARTPPMGWNTWNQFQCNINEKIIQQVADAMERYKLIELGYKYLIIDDCWQDSSRDKEGKLRANPQTFPSGIAALASYVKSKGASLGIYTDIGLNTCQGKPGSYQHFEEDIETFFSWGIEYVKVDYCYKTWDEIVQPAPYYQNISNAIMKHGGKMVFSVCEWGWESPWTWAPKMANSWRISNDIWPEWERILEIADVNSKLSSFAGPGHWNDPDMIEVGVNGTVFNYKGMPTTWLNEHQSVSHYSLWAMMSAPLILGNDLRNMPDWVRLIISNPLVIAINQDSLGLQGSIVSEVSEGSMIDGYCLVGHCVHTQVWAKKLDVGIAVLLFNRAQKFDVDAQHFSSEDITISWTDLGIPESTTMKVTDVWTKKEYGLFSQQFTAQGIVPNGSILLLLQQANNSPVIEA